MSQLSNLARALLPNQRSPRKWTINRGGRQPFVQNRPSNYNIGLSLPAAYATHVRPRFNILSRSGDSVRVSGCDLVYQLPSTITTGDGSVFSVIPSNPNYWVGTRIAQFASAYQNFRPVSMTFSYIPQVAVTQPGTVVMGTLWNDAPPSQNLQQSLFTSNGGTMTQCYVPCDTTIALGTNLQQNLFTGSGDLNYDTNPFIFVALLRGANVVPGYFYVSYIFDFKNAIGLSREFQNYAATAGTIEFAQNVTILIKSPITGYGAGTLMDVEFTDSSSYSVNYHGSPVTVPSETEVQVFSNSQIGSAQSSLLAEIARLTAIPAISKVRLGSSTSNFADRFKVATSSTNIVQNTPFITYFVKENYIEIGYVTSSSGFTPSPDSDVKYYYYTQGPLTSGTLELLDENDNEIASLDTFSNRIECGDFKATIAQ